MDKATKDSGKPPVKGKVMAPAGDTATRAATAAGGGAGSPPATADAEPRRPRIGPVKFVQQVMQEFKKVTWPSRQETIVTTIMVFVMVFLAAAFFAVVDVVLAFLRDALLKLL